MRIQGSSVSVKYNKIDGIKKIYYHEQPSKNDASFNKNPVRLDY